MEKGVDRVATTNYLTRGDEVGRFRVFLKGGESGKSGSSTTQGMGESFLLKSFPKNLFVPVRVF
jgi:hypothetical protein